MHALLPDTQAPPIPSSASRHTVAAFVPSCNQSGQRLYATNQDSVGLMPGRGGGAGADSSAASIVCKFDSWHLVPRMLVTLVQMCKVTEVLAVSGADCGVKLEVVPFNVRNLCCRLQLWGVVWWVQGQHTRVLENNGRDWNTGHPLRAARKWTLRNHSATTRFPPGWPAQSPQDACTRALSLPAYNVFHRF